MFAVTMQVAKAVLQKNANVRKSSEGALKGLSMQINPLLQCYLSVFNAAF